MPFNVNSKIENDAFKYFGVKGNWEGKLTGR